MFLYPILCFNNESETKKNINDNNVTKDSKETKDNNVTKDNNETDKCEHRTVCALTQQECINPGL